MSGRIWNIDERKSCKWSKTSILTLWFAFDHHLKLYGQFTMKVNSKKERHLPAWQMK